MNEGVRWPQAAVAAFACGLYVATFYILGNLTMLSPSSVALVATVLALPVVLAVLAALLVLRLAGQQRHAGFAAAFIIGVYLLLALRSPIFSIGAVMDFREQLKGPAWVALHLAYFLLPAALLGFLFRRHPGRLAVVLAVMTAAALLSSLRSGREDSETRIDPVLAGARLDRRPNIHYIVADSFSSLDYMKGRGIDVSALETGLAARGFRLYRDTYANYHSTLDSMQATLGMRHHHYRGSQKQAEVSRTRRQEIGGNNSLVRLLKNNGYRTQYIHQHGYLLLQGCTADDCLPADQDSLNLAGAREVLEEIVPHFLLHRIPNTTLQRYAPDQMRREISRLAGVGRESGSPLFQYIHLYRPNHVRNAMIGRCDEREEQAAYAGRVAETIPVIQSFVNEILQADPDAVVIVGGDHGPFIAHRCEREADIGTVDAYRDRVGVLTAIRWPAGYDGRFDDRIRSNVNLFRFLLASLIDGSEDALGGREPDDVFVHGGQRRVLEILDDGEYLMPPVVLTADDTAG